MTATQLNQNGVLSLISHAGPMAQFVLIVLLGASIHCWAIIFAKWRSLKRALTENAQFLTIFWHGKTIDDIMAKSDRFAASPVAAVFRSGVKELKKLSAEELASAGVEKVDNIQRALVRASNTEMAQLERHVSWLATTASAAPFVGLFGTVWGIMNSFQSIGASGAANLAVVAPGISEALITTATGIGAAIPAVVAYNYFAGQIKRAAIDMDSFSQDFMNIIQRSVLAGKKGN
ncbi:MAG: protein TolQ [Oligoflexia bacterium]|nr:protein TolQ [Oligoflexia bacterium]